MVAEAADQAGFKAAIDHGFEQRSEQHLELAPLLAAERADDRRQELGALIADP
jgi:hypothetical protein